MDPKDLEGLTPEQIAERFDAVEKSRKELEQKVSEQGEQLTQKDAALDGYLRGQPSPGNGGGNPPAKPKDDDPMPDQLTDPDQYREWLNRQFDKREKAATQNAIAFLNAQKAAEQMSRDFFGLYPDLVGAEDLVDMASARYMQINGNDPLVKSNPEAFKLKAFKAVAEDVKARIAKLTGAKGGKKAPFFETPSGSAPGRGKGADTDPDPENPQYESETEMQQSEGEAYIKEKSRLRGKK